MDIIREPRNTNKKLPYLCEFLREHRVKLGLSQVDFAKKIGVGVKTLRKIEQGDLGVNFKKLKYIFNSIGLDLVPGELVTAPVRRKRKALSKLEIISILESIYSIFKIKYGLKSLALFGSYAKDLASDESDIDVLIEINKPLSFEVEGEIQLILETLFEGRKVDITLRKNLRQEFIEEIMETKIEIKERI